MDDETLLHEFLNGSLSPERWHHREHIKVAYLLLRQYPLEVAIGRMGQGLQALNAAQGVPDTPNRGYNETITQAWMRLVDFTLVKFGPAANADQFVNDHPEIANPYTLRLFYSHERLWLPEAKAEYLHPDLHPLKVWYAEPLATARSDFPREPRSIEANIVVSTLGLSGVALALYLLLALFGGRGEAATLTLTLLLLVLFALPVFIAASAVGRRYTNSFWATQHARNIATGIYLALAVCIGIGARLLSESVGGFFLPLGIAAMVGMPVIVLAWLFSREVKPRPANAPSKDTQVATPHPLD
jgi:hypothetical protein